MFNENRTYGVEIELAITDSEAQKVFRTLKREGINIEREGYGESHSTPYDHWKWTTDVSCRLAGQNDGYELVSPILSGYEGFEEIERVLDIVNGLFDRDIVNRKCGLHVHHGVEDYGWQELKKLYGLYINYENTIDELVPNSRRGNNNQWCRSVKEPNHDRLGFSQRTMLERLIDCNSRREIMNLFHSKYIKLNCQSLNTKETIEFRQHSGTANTEKIINWVKLTQNMVEKAADKRTRELKEIKETADAWKTLAQKLSLQKSQGGDAENIELCKFYVERRNQLAA